MDREQGRIVVGLMMMFMGFANFAFVILSNISGISNNLFFASEAMLIITSSSAGFILFSDAIIGEIK